METFRLSRTARLVLLVHAGFGVVFAVGVVVAGLQHGPTGLVLAIAVDALGAGVLGWLHRPLVTSIEVHDDGRLIFHGVLGSVAADVSDLLAVTPDTLDIMRIHPVFHFRQCRIRLLLRLEWFEYLLAALRRMNPGARIDV